MHADSTSMLKPFNGSIFDLRDSYEIVFPNLGNSKDADISKVGDSENLEKKTMYKINYRLNMLPNIGIHINNDNGNKVTKNADISIMQLCS